MRGMRAFPHKNILAAISASGVISVKSSGKVRAALCPCSALLAACMLLASVAVAFCQIDPAATYSDLFKEVQMAPVFHDSKKFPDCVPKFPPREIVKKYTIEKNRKGFDLAAFVAANFDTMLTEKNDTARMLRHIDLLWSALERPSDSALAFSSLIPLPHTYIVPGGRFREIYYWDSYFTMLGLKEAGKTELMRNIIDNFCFLLDAVGHIPNGNRTYYAGRSQPPFFSLMVELLAQAKGPQVLDRYLPWLEKEYDFWMKGRAILGKTILDTLRVVLLPNGAVLNRYYDNEDGPRPESYKEDVRLAGHAVHKKEIYRNLRAAAESGWDFSSRWFSDTSSLDSIHTIDIAPVDLNCLLYHLESVIAKAYARKNQKDRSRAYVEYAEKRKKAILDFCWDEKAGYFFDYDFKKSARTPVYSMAGAYPLFFPHRRQPAGRLCDQSA